MTAYYNEIDPYAAQWLRNLIAAGLIAPGDVDTRSIEEVIPNDIKGYAQVHMFAGLGVWSYALRQAGWADDRPAMTLSCPCQPFSSAGKRKGFDDARHLWPHAFKLISQCHPGTVFGEQVSGKNGLAWLDAVQDDLERSGYAVGALGISAAGVGAPHIRRRLYFVADAEYAGPLTEFEFESPNGTGRVQQPEGSYPSPTNVSRNPDQQRRQGRRLQSGKRACQCPVGQTGEVTGHCADSACEQMGAAGQSRGEDAGANSTSQRWHGSGNPTGPGRRDGSEDGSPLRGFWADAEWLPTVDGRYMPAQRGIFPMAARTAGRVEQLRAYGNSLCAETAIEFVKAYMESATGSRPRRGQGREKGDGEEIAMPDKYVSDDHVVINIQGLRTVRRENYSSTSGGKWGLLWNYKGQDGCHMYVDKAERDVMYEKLRKALTAEKERKQTGGYSKLNAIMAIQRRLGQMACMSYEMTIADATALIETLEPIMRPGGPGDAV